MTKLKKGAITPLTGKVEDIYPNLVIIADKNIAVPIDKKSIIDEWVVGDTVEIRYDDRGYLLGGTVTEKGIVPGREVPEPIQLTEPEKSFAKTMKEKFTVPEHGRFVEPSHTEPERNLKSEIKLHQQEERKKGAVEECRVPTREELLGMVYDYNTYWKAKTLMDIQAHDEIRHQVNWKNWQECINSAIEAYKAIDFPEGTNHIKMIDELAEHFHTFILGNIKDTDTLMNAGELK